MTEKQFIAVFSAGMLAGVLFEGLFIPGVAHLVAMLGPPFTR